MHHVGQLTLSTYCNSPSSSSLITSFLIFLLSFPLHSSLNYSSEKGVLLIMWLNHFLCQFQIIPFRNWTFSSTICGISSFVWNSIHLTRSYTSPYRHPEILQYLNVLLSHDGHTINQILSNIFIIIQLQLTLYFSIIISQEALPHNCFSPHELSKPCGIISHSSNKDSRLTRYRRT